MEGAWKGSRRRSAGVSQPAAGARAGAVRAQPWRLRSLALPAPRTRRSQTKGGLTRWRRERASQPANSPTHPPTLPPRAGGRGRPGPAGSARRGRGGARRPPHLSGPGPVGVCRLLPAPRESGGASRRWVSGLCNMVSHVCVFFLSSSSSSLSPPPAASLLLPKHTRTHTRFPSPSPSSRPKRQAKPAADEGFWDCSVCTFRNSAEAFKCSICDVRKGTSTRKPRINSQLVAQQVAQQYATPPPPKKEKKEKVEKQDKEKPDKEKEISPSVTKKNTNKKTKPKSDIVKDPPSEANSIQSGNTTTKTSDSNHTSRPRLKNVDRSTAQQLAVTVGNVTVIITDFKEKTRSSSTSSSTVTSSAGSEQQNQSSSGSESTDKGSSRSSTPKGDMSAVNDESF
ncbi:RING1 and YY1-binding protein isoform X1 [Zonotrichia albicollis]